MDLRSTFRLAAITALAFSSGIAAVAAAQIARLAFF
jgi:hypothetical protein